MKTAQFCFRGNTVHVQVGSKDNYDKFDLPGNSAIRKHFDAQLAAGNYRYSLAGTSTKYVPVMVQEKVIRRIVIPASSTVVETPEIVLQEG